MSERAEQLKSALLELPEIERIEVADFLYGSTESFGSSEVRRGELNATIRVRLEEYRTGQDPGMLAEDFFKLLQEERAAKQP